MSNTEWLEKRRQGIGGSEIAVLLGVNPYKTPYQLWLDKTGRSPPVEENKYMITGRLMEPVIVELFRQATNLEILTETQENILHVHPQYSFALGTPDRIYKDGDQFGILECKNTSRFLTPDKLPKSWFCQVQWYMGILGYKQAYLAWLVQGVDLHYERFEFDSTLFNFMIEKAQYFWELVKEDTPPELMNSMDVELMFPKSIGGDYILAMPETALIIDELRNIRSKLTVLKQEEIAIIDRLKCLMRHSEAIVDGSGRILISWKTSENGKSRRFILKNEI